MERIHLVRQGDYLDRIAQQYGADADAVWDHPANRELRDRRASPNVLAPGDRLHIPPPEARAPIALRIGETNRFDARVPKVKVSFYVRGADGALADEPFVVEGVVGAPRGTTSAEGLVEFEVSLQVREVLVVFPRLNREHPVRVGELDPLDEPTGLAQRLGHLGYLGRAWESSLARATATEEDAALQALQAFQLDRGLRASGTADDETLAALRDEHGA